MGRWLTRRLAITFVTFIGITLLVFVLMRLAPVSPVDILLFNMRNQGGLPPGDIQALARQACCAAGPRQADPDPVRPLVEGDRCQRQPGLLVRHGPPLARHGGGAHPADAHPARHGPHPRADDRHSPRHPRRAAPEQGHGLHRLVTRSDGGGDPVLLPGPRRDLRLLGQARLASGRRHVHAGQTHQPRRLAPSPHHARDDPRPGRCRPDPAVCPDQHPRDSRPGLSRDGSREGPTGRTWSCAMPSRTACCP